MGRIFETRKATMFARWDKMSKAFTRIGKEISIAVKAGGPNPDNNLVLRRAIQNARAVNMPKDKVEAAIKRAAGRDQANFEEILYEGYAPHGVAILVECATDNPTRTAGNVRSIFTKWSGNLGSTGSVAFQFKHCGQMLFAPGTDEAALMDAAIEAGADDVVTNDDGSIEVLTPPNDFLNVKEALEKVGFKPEFGEVTMKAENESELTGDDAVKMQKLIDALESLDDVQEVYSTAVMDE